MTSPLALWTSFVVLFAVLSYGLRFSEGKPPKNLLYQWTTVESSVIPLNEMPRSARYPAMPAERVVP